MRFPDLKQLHKILNWHQDGSSGEHVGIFLPLPTEIAEQFPDKEGEDSSPPHVTVLYLGQLPRQFEDRLREVVAEVCKQVKPFNVKLSSPKKFQNDDNQIIRHSPVTSMKLKKLNYLLKKGMYRNHIPFSNKHPDFKPHVTIEYINEGEKPTTRGLRPKGKWLVDSLWIWGGSEPHLITLGK